GVPGRAGRVDPARRCGQCRPVVVVHHGDRGGGVTAGSVDEGQAAVGAEQERLPDVAAGLAAVGVVDRVDLAPLVRRSAGCGDGGDQLAEGLVGGHRAVVGGAAVVLDLLQGQQVGGGQVVHDDGGQPVELGLRVGRRQVLHVERGHRDLVLHRL